MEQYREYLREKGYRPRTIDAYAGAAQKLHMFLERTSQELTGVDVDLLYRYKEYLEEMGNKTRGAINDARSLVHYFNFLGWDSNPALLLQFTKRTRTLPKGIMDKYELEELYVEMEAKTPIQKRDLAMFGLVVFQGITRNELQVLELEDLDFDQGTIHIPATQKTNSRILPLDQKQKENLFHYVLDVRDELLRTSEKEDSPYMFFSQGSGEKIDNTLARFLGILKRKHPAFTTITNIRQSRITHWVQTEELPKAQYYSGIKYLSSMMRYHSEDIEELKKKMKVFHPWEGYF